MTEPPGRETPLTAALHGARRMTDLGVVVAGDYGDVASEYDSLVSAAGLIDQTSRGVVRVTGADASAFLQSLLSQDLDPVGIGGGARSLLLEPRGKLVADMRVLRVADDEWWLDTEVGVGEVVAGSLARYRVRVAVEIADLGDEWGVIAVRGPEAGGVTARVLGVDLPEVAHASVAVAAGNCRAVRAGTSELSGVDVIGPVSELGSAWESLAGEVPTVGLAAYEAARIEAGVPRQGHDVDGSTIAQEAFLERDAVSFEKGCFLGQELVCRVEMRGHVNRFLRGVVADETTTTLRRGDALILGDREVGSVTSAATSPVRGPVALAMVRREVEPPEGVVLLRDGEHVGARVLALPLRDRSLPAADQS